MNHQAHVGGESVSLNSACIVCKQEKAAGIRICGVFLCADCERAIVSTDVEDARYPYYIECMKQIWLAAIS
ncbi:sigma factor G inhibitor Gin [Alicyclobacillus cycloheptanicus]|jgi:hypothetical protein|uniref:Inhibitor of sigma-G Gin n=1 Tax=Alicyclobacillus cycloheptanicus TaxID=1457 RepID=A0ABT9XJ08_9BACL|nr:sigma factor G inhibitor Gin [Alicyclobacillus cycloheptanicus]MDQ0190187.1 hypothetical protein [Alicyclobacillus cycloheptanicus]WDM02562.1 sigma factor G inhibitor Gin [Alicyclobacillus cycloheptanicus]